MKTMLRVLLVTALLLLFTAAIASAATTLKAPATASGQTDLEWAYTAGDSIEYSLDGITWTAVPSTGAGPYLVDPAKVSAGKVTVKGLTDYTNYYFRINNAGVFSTIAVAYPPDEHAHKYFAADTNMCAQCHSAHAAKGYHMTKEPTIDGVCKTCHAGTGSKYQVDDGTVAMATGTAPALGGLFGDKFNKALSVTPTSAHQLGATLTTAPGGDSGDGNGKWNKALGCASCHSAHTGPGYQYRLLKNAMPYQAVDASGNAIPITVEAYAVTKPAGEQGVYVKGLNPFCGGCHADYNTTSAAKSAENPSGVFNTTYYRHQVGNDIKDFRHVGLDSTLPLEASKYAGASLADGSVHTTGTIACITCHKPHGVDTVMESGSSSLLRLPNRTVCQNCHKKE